MYFGHFLGGWGVGRLLFLFCFFSAKRTSWTIKYCDMHDRHVHSANFHLPLTLLSFSTYKYFSCYS